MPRVIRSPQAKIDLLEIWIFIASRHGAARADKVIAKLKKACSRLGSFPMIGPERSELQPGLRSFPESDS